MSVWVVSFSRHSYITNSAKSALPSFILRSFWVTKLEFMTETWTLIGGSQLRGVGGGGKETNLVCLSFFHSPHSHVLCFDKMCFALILLFVDRFSIALFSALEHSLHSHVILHEWPDFYCAWPAFYSAFLNIHRSGVFTPLAWLVPHKTAAVSAHVLCTPYNHAPCHFMQSHIRILAVTCHLHCWQNDGLLHATVVTRGWNGYRSKSKHRKLIPEKEILPPLLVGFEPATFQSRVRLSNHWAIPAPRWYITVDWALRSDIFLSICLSPLSPIIMTGISLGSFKLWIPLRLTCRSIINSNYAVPCTDLKSPSNRRKL